MIWAEQRATDGGVLLLRMDYQYDVFGRRAEQTRTVPGVGVTETRFGLDGDNVWADLDGTNALQAARQPDGIDGLGAGGRGGGGVVPGGPPGLVQA
jgi:hypothetical protein